MRGERRLSLANRGEHSTVRAMNKAGARRRTAPRRAIPQGSNTSTQAWAAGYSQHNAERTLVRRAPAALILIAYASDVAVLALFSCGCAGYAMPCFDQGGFRRLAVLS